MQAHRDSESQKEILLQFAAKRHKSLHCPVNDEKKCQGKGEVYSMFLFTKVTTGYGEHAVGKKEKIFSKDERKMCIDISIDILCDVVQRLEEPF